jgi:hypothetical protein
MSQLSSVERPQRPFPEALRAAGHRADAFELSQHVVSADLTPFLPNGLLFEGTHELGVESGVERQFGEPLGDDLLLHATPLLTAGPNRHVRVMRPEGQRPIRFGGFAPEGCRPMPADAGRCRMVR